MRANRIKGILGIALFALCLLAEYGWMRYGDDFSAKTVLVAKGDIREGTEIQNMTDYFDVVKKPDEDIVKNALTEKDLNSIHGLAVKQFIPQNGQVTAAFFEKPGMAIYGDKFVFKIPSSWIYAVPSSIRSGDDVSFYEVDSNIEKNIGAEVRKNEDGTLATYGTPIRTGSASPVLDATIKYVKDSTNREVVDTEGPKRFDGTSQVASLEIVCTEVEMKLLETGIIDGMKFIVVYR